MKNHRHALTLVVGFDIPRARLVAKGRGGGSKLTVDKVLGEFSGDLAIIATGN